MNWIILFLIVFGFFFAKSSTAKLLFLMFGVSVSSSLLLGDGLPFEYSSFCYVLFVCSFLFILFYSFNSLNSSNISRFYVGKDALKVLKFVLYLSAVGVAVNVYIFIQMMLSFMANGVPIEVFKNGAVGLDSFREINPAARAISALLSPLSYICLPLHFYFLVHNKILLSKFSFYGSLSIIIEQLAFFGRGGIVVFVSVYVLLLIFVLPVLNDAIKRRKIKSGIIFLCVVVGLFLYIAIDRFSDYTSFEYGGYVTNPILISILGYYGEWISNGYRAYLQFVADKMIPFSNFMYFPNKILEVLNYPIQDIVELRDFAFGDKATNFNGLPVLVLYDMHYIGAYLFSGLFFLSSRFFLRSRGHRDIGINQFIFAGLAMPIPVMFFQGVHFVHGGYNVAIIYFAVLLIATKLRAGRLKIFSRKGCNQIKAKE